jgi:hypothetical protein
LPQVTQNPNSFNDERNRQVDSERSNRSTVAWPAQYTSHHISGRRHGARPEVGPAASRPGDQTRLNHEEGEPLPRHFRSAAPRIICVIQRLSLTRDLASIMEIVRHEARVLVNADGASFVLREGDRCFYADEGGDRAFVEGSAIPAGDVHQRLEHVESQERTRIEFGTGTDQAGRVIYFVRDKRGGVRSEVRGKIVQPLSTTALRDAVRGDRYRTYLRATGAALDRFGAS